MVESRAQAQKVTVSMQFGILFMSKQTAMNIIIHTKLFIYLAHCTQIVRKSRRRG